MAARSEVVLQPESRWPKDRTIEVAGISDELLGQLDERARQIGIDRNSYVRKIIERAVAPPRAAATLGGLLTPVHDFTEAHGISDKDVERFFNDQVAESRRQRRKPGELGR
jgi:hypothetical protein